jgi:hypothetical protein
MGGKMSDLLKYDANATLPFVIRVTTDWYCTTLKDTSVKARISLAALMKRLESKDQKYCKTRFELVSLEDYEKIKQSQKKNG